MTSTEKTPATTTAKAGTCRFCRKSNGVLHMQAASSDYIPARRGYNAIGIGPSHYHRACMDKAAAFHDESGKRWKAETDLLQAKLYAALWKSRPAVLNGPGPCDDTQCPTCHCDVPSLMGGAANCSQCKDARAEGTDA